ncbi:MAG: porin family protein [Deltaproteobacteria bacterium]|nr:porin family protein [Deltaproteobacteria bacterium]
MTRFLKSMVFAGLLCVPLVSYAQDPDEPKGGDEGGQQEEGQETESQGTEQPKIQPKEETTPVPAAHVQNAAAKPMPVPAPEIVRAESGNFGIYFSFGGIATLAVGATGRKIDKNRVGNAVAFAGLKLVPSDNIVIPVGIGLSFGHSDIDGDAGTNNFGMALSGGLEYHFRVWHRISPYIGAKAQLDYLDPTGDDNWEFGINLGPSLGVEYYIADRLSLSAEYNFLMDLRFSDAKAVGGDLKSDLLFSTGVTNAGTVYISFYF